MNTEIIEKFLAFLDREGAKEKYFANITDESINGLPELVKADGTFDFEAYSVRAEVPEKLILRAFMWFDTPEGDEFWRTLSNKWKEEVMNERK